MKAIIAITITTISLWGCASSAPASEGGACAELGKAAAPSAACCVDFGVDACGASLFCAALDGRTQAVCYPEYTRLDGAECTADVQCWSAGCDTSVKKCKASPLTTCDPAIGCGPGPSPGAQAMACASIDNGYNTSISNGSKCQPIGYGVCGADSDCASGKCGFPEHRCLTEAGGKCKADAECASGACSTPGTTQGYCLAELGGFCYWAGGCRSQICESDVCVEKCDSSCLAQYSLCETGAQCASGSCGAAPAVSGKTVCLGSPGDPCGTADGNCASGTCVAKKCQ